MKEENREESATQALRRLRRELNRLKRELQSQRTRAANEAAQAAAEEARLRAELASIKESRVWRTALLLRRARELVSGRGVRALGESLMGGGRRAGGETTDARARQYEEYVAANALTPQRRAHLEGLVKSFPSKPLVSIVMPVYNAEPQVLDAAVASVRAQIYDHWELCIVDDASSSPETVRALENLPRAGTRIERLERNLDIAGATNRAIEMAAGDYILFMDHDDQLSADALVEVVAEINRSGADFIYSDEDNIDEDGRRVNPHFKPDFSPDLLLAHNYITHLVAVRRDLLERVGGLRSELDGAQDYDFVLRATEQAERVRHIPRILYHWRMSDTSTSVNAGSKPRALERGRLALDEALQRRGRDGAAEVDPVAPHFYRVRYALKDAPLISILIPFRDEPELLHCVIGDVVEKSTYGNFEVLGLNNNSTGDETLEAMRDLSGMDERVRFEDYNHPFSFSGIMNHGARLSAGEHLVFLNNDIRILTAEWLVAMLEHSQRDEVGAVGGKLYYPDGRVQHAGIIVGIDGFAGHSHKGFPGDHHGYFNRLRVVQNVSAVTGAFMMVKKTVFDAAGGFDEESFGVACNDVDLCLRFRERGLWNVFTPYAEALHVESATRGYEDTPDKQARHARERAVFAERHADILRGGDPFYNPNLTTTAEDFTTAVPQAPSPSGRGLG